MWVGDIGCPPACMRCSALDQLEIFQPKEKSSLLQAGRSQPAFTRNIMNAQKICCHSSVEILFSKE